VNYFKTTAIVADSLDLNKLLHEKIVNNFNELSKKNGKDFTNLNEIREYYIDGTEILEFIKENKKKYFNKNTYDLVGVEMPMLVQSDLNKKIGVVLFIDIALKNKITNKYKIIDIKTSYRGWQKGKKKDFSTTCQLLFYKKYFSENLKIPLDDVEIEFFIVKRKLWESEFKQKRVQLFSPANGKISMKKFEVELNRFINIFDENGVLKEGLVFNKTINKKNCKECVFFKTNYCK
jgi:hypothetical protein